MPSSPLLELTNYILTSANDILELRWDDVPGYEKDGLFFLERLLRWEEYEDFATDFCDFQDVVKKNTTITTIDLNFSFRLRDWRQAFWIINTLYRHLQNVSTLKIRYHGAFPGATTTNPFHFLLRGSDRFEKIQVSSIGGYTEAMHFQWSWLKPEARLQKLEVQNFGSISLISMAAALAPLSNLKELNITDCKLRATEETDPVGRIDYVAAIPAFFQLSTLRTLELDVVDFTNQEFVDGFAQGISESSIENLDLNYKCSTAGQYTRMAEGIVNCRSLRTLDLGNKGRLDVQFPVLPLLRSHRDLRLLDLVCYSKVPDEDVEELATGMMQGTLGGSLSQLSLSLLTPVHLCLMLTAIRESTSLVTVGLVIEPVPLSEEIVQRIDAFRRAPSLKHVFIQSHGPNLSLLDLDRELEVEKRLSQNFGMHYIVLPWLRGASHDRLRTICQLNEHGRSYLLSDNPSKADGVNVLAKHGCVNGNDTRQLDFLFTHLRENPGLCSRDDC